MIDLFDDEVSSVGDKKSLMIDFAIAQPVKLNQQRLAALKLYHEKDY